MSPIGLSDETCAGGGCLCVRFVSLLASVTLRPNCNAIRENRVVNGTCLPDGHHLDPLTDLVPKVLYGRLLMLVMMLQVPCLDGR